MDGLNATNYWNKRVNIKFPGSAQSLLRPENANNQQALANSCSSCGQGECNCGGGCNGECSTSCEGNN